MFLQDSDALSRAQQVILQLQAEVERIHNTTQNIIEENELRVKQIEVCYINSTLRNTE